MASLATRWLEGFNQATSLTLLVLDTNWSVALLPYNVLKTIQRGALHLSLYHLLLYFVYPCGFLINIEVVHYCLFPCNMKWCLCHCHYSDYSPPACPVIAVAQYQCLLVLLEAGIASILDYATGISPPNPPGTHQHPYHNEIAQQNWGEERRVTEEIWKD